MIILVMGVSGSGKTTIGGKIAEMLGSAFVEGDTFHPPKNVTKMRGGSPLEDADRWPWLNAIARRIDEAIAEGSDLVVACSALKSSYRQILSGNRCDVHLVHLEGTPELIRSRMETRVHFMPPALMDSQFEVLEAPGASERAIVINVARSPDECVAAVKCKLRQRQVIP